MISRYTAHLLDLETPQIDLADLFAQSKNKSR